MKQGERVMAIQQISRVEVDQCTQLRSFIEGMIGQGVEWFIDGAGSVIGTFAKEKTGEEWGYIILRRDAQGEFGSYNIRQGMNDKLAARAQVIADMEATVRERRARVSAQPRELACCN